MRKSLSLKSYGELPFVQFFTSFCLRPFLKFLFTAGPGWKFLALLTCVIPALQAVKQALVMSQASRVMVKSTQKHKAPWGPRHMGDKGEIIIYQSPDGETGIKVKVLGETV